MKTTFKFIAAAALTGAFALAAITPGQARGGNNAAAAIGFGAGALVGAAVVGSNSGYYNGPGGYYGPSYYSDPVTPISPNRFMPGRGAAIAAEAAGSSPTAAEATAITAPADIRSP